MRITVIGTGYVGLVTGTCFAESGNHVTCLDINAEKIESLRRGVIPIYEPGLTEMVLRNTAAGLLEFSTSYPEAIAGADMIFMAVGTPPDERGRADLTYLFKAVESLAPHLPEDAVVVVKSTVPVGTNNKVFARLNELTKRQCHVASNPEFLKEGAAINDFQYPDRVVVGVRGPDIAARLEDLYKPFLRNNHPFVVMSPASAEFTKYAANALLATKISFINEMANLCELLGADINDVRQGIGHDRRIGFQFLFPGVGYGGSCFPKDVHEIAGLARDAGMEPRILAAVESVNQAQKSILLDKILDHFSGALKGRRIALWGLAFKPQTDDIREAPGLVLAQKLTELGVDLCVYDPAAMPNVRKEHGDRFRYATGQMEALQGAEALVIMTEWRVFQHPDFAEMKAALRSPVIFDGRNLYDREQIKKTGFTYYSIGRAAVRPEK